MDIIADAAAALKPISDDGITVRQGWYDANAKKLHITLWNISDTIAASSDDMPEVEAGAVQINIWSNKDQVALKNRVKKLLRLAGFDFVEGHDELETDTRVFINALRFSKIQEIDEMEE